MGYAERINAALRARLAGLKVAVDIQHRGRTGDHAGDQGTVFTLASGAKLAEAQAVVVYAQALTSWLQARGAFVLTNDPARGILMGPYSRRNVAASAWGATAYLACHLNAGGGHYALCEYMVGSSAQTLAFAIASTLDDRFAEIRGAKANPLVTHQRGAVCIEAVPRGIPAVVVEPFFGDTPECQTLLAHDRLVAVGEAIGEGLAGWYGRPTRK